MARVKLRLNKDTKYMLLINLQNEKPLVLAIWDRSNQRHVNLRDKGKRYEIKKNKPK